METKQKEYLKQYRDKNKAKIKEYQEKYRMNNKANIKENKKKYRNDNKEKIKKQAKEYKEKNTDKIKAYRSIYRKKNIENIKESNKKWYLKNKENIKLKVKDYKKKRKNNDPLFKINSNIRSIISNLLTNRGFTKKSKTYEIVGCSFSSLINYLEAKFEPWMDWDNYGKYNGEMNYGWDIDHIVPISTAKTEEDIIKLNHYSNLQPLCSYVNRVIKKNN